jgi:tetraacyldisaccharide 4'-kinase
MDVPQVDSPVASFCGIARPQQFFAGLEAGGLSLATRISFEDHHRYTRSDVERLVAQARRAEASVLITTEKDKVRLGGLTSAFPASLPLKTAHLQSEFEDEHAVLSWLEQKMAARSGN